MSIYLNKNKVKFNIINTSYKKIKINNLFFINKFVIYIKFYEINSLKNKFLNYNIINFILNDKYIKVLFNLPNFAFLRGEGLFCLFIDNIIVFINIIKIIEKKQFFYSYKNCFSNIVNGYEILNDYNKYNMNYIYIQFILKKKIIKIIILLLFFLIYIIKYIK
jgi:hypothetical protein